MRITVKEFAALHGVHRSTVQAWIDRGWIKAKRQAAGPAAYWTIDEKTPRPIRRPGPKPNTASKKAKRTK